MKIDLAISAKHGTEFAYLLNHYLTEHLVRCSRAFDGDLTATLILGTIAHQNLRRFHEEVVTTSGESMRALIQSGAHRDFLRPCNTMSISASTGIPRETVRRKVAWLVGRGWVRRVGRNQLFIDERVGQDFAEFNLDTVRLFAELMTRFEAVTNRRRGVRQATGGVR